MLKPGLYEQIISQSLSRELASVSDACKHVEKLDAAEAPQALAGYVAEAVRAALEAMPSGTEEQSAQRIALVNKVLDVLSQQREDLSEKSVDDRAEKLLQILQENDPGRITGMTAAKMPRPETPMAVSSLFTGAAHEPKMFTELQKEIASADRIDMLVSFVKWSGLRLIMDEVKALGFCVSVQHAHFMAEHFNIAGIPAMALDSHSSDEERRTARDKLISGDVRVIFAVDLYNEGVDIPAGGFSSCWTFCPGWTMWIFRSCRHWSSGCCKCFI